MHTRITLFFISILFVITNTRGQNKINAIAKVNQEQGNYAVSLRRLLEIFKLTDEQLKKDKISIMDSVRNYLNGIPDIKNGKNPKYDKLISDYAFRKLIKKNFHSLILGNDEVSKIGRYATLDIADKTNFSFSPLVFESNTFKRRFQHIFSLTVSGKTNGAGIFRLKEFRDLKAAFSWKFILPLTNYKPVGRAESLSKFKHILNEGINDLSDSYEEKFKKIDSSKFLGEAQKKEHKIKLGKQFIEEYTDMEVISAEEFWRSKNFFWLSWDINFFGRDKVNFIDRISLISGAFKQIEKSFYTPGSIIGFNYYTVTRKQHSFLFTASAGLQVKHSLSEVYEPTDFQNYKTINDSVSLLKGTEAIFITDFSEIDKKGVFDFGIRTVYIAKLSESPILNRAGLSVSFSRKGLVGNGKSPSLFRTEIGLVFPFINSKGESGFNLEIFKRWDTYSNFPNDNSNFWGARFNVPISN